MTKEIISIKVNITKADPMKITSDIMVVGVFSGKSKGSICSALDQKLKGAISNLFKLGDFKGDAGSLFVVYSEGAVNSRRIILVGLGEKKKADLETLRTAVIKSVCRAVDLKAKKIALAVHQDLIGTKDFDIQAVGRVIAEASHFGGYRYDEFLEKKKAAEERPKSISVSIIDNIASNISKMKKSAAIGNVTGTSQNYARTIMNRPANIIYPESLAMEAKKLARSVKGLSCMVWDYGQIKARHLGGLLAVGQGAEHKPRFIVLKYSPSKATAKTPTIGLVGKAVTFDSGGISIKPGAGMHDMKFDKSGGVAVLGAMKIISALKPKVKVFGIIPSAENMPGANSYRPGDIITTYSGKTVEIQNTDAEGRMILCDGIHYAVKQKCQVIVDIATLTGACVVALGEGKSGIFSNNDKVVEQLKAASEKTSESVWHMPTGPEYLEQMKSKVADLKNIGGKWGGACSAAAFLSAFAGDIKWAHIDMAGVGMVDGQQKYGIPGSIGYGAKLLAEFVCNYK